MSDETAADDETEEEQPVPILEVETVAENRQTGDHQLAARAVMDVLSDRLKAAESGVERGAAFGEAGNAINDLAAEADDPNDVKAAVEAGASEVAQQTGTPTSGIIEQLNDAGLPDRIEEHREEQLTEMPDWSVPVGIGLDTYLEEYLEEVVVQRSTDHVDETDLRWRFRDGAVVETSESLHHDYYQFFQALDAATTKRLVPEVASEQAEEELNDDEETDGEMYAKHSRGPADRPWHTENKLWSRAVSGLVEERARTVTVTGRRTDAWETLKNRVGTGRAVRNLTDAVTQQMVYVDEENSEIWVPSGYVDNAADTVETSRRAMQAELSERGVITTDLGGSRVSESVKRNGTARRFWRFDLDAEEVPEPEVILDEVQEAADSGIFNSADGTSTEESFGGPAATDGGEAGETEPESDPEAGSTDGGEGSTDDRDDAANGGDGQ